MIAGLPTNSQQRLEIGKLKEQIAALERENQELKSRLTLAVPTSDMPVDTAKMLQHFFKNDRPFTAEHIARIFGMETNVAKYHIDLLLKKHFIWHHERVIVDNSPGSYVIHSKGRAYVIEHGMA